MERTLVVESILTNPNQYDRPAVIVLAEECDAGPAHAKRLYVTGDLDLLHCGGVDQVQVGDEITVQL